MKNKKPKNSKRVRSAVRKLHEIAEILHYFMGNHDQFKTMLREKFDPIEDLLVSLSLEKKQDHIRLFQKFKQLQSIVEKENNGDIEKDS